MEYIKKKNNPQKWKQMGQNAELCSPKYFLPSSKQVILTCLSSQTQKVT